MVNLGFKKRKWEIFCRLFSIFPKTSIGSCRTSDNHHLGRLLIKSGYTLDMKHKSWITLSAYILKTKCRNLVYFFFFLSLWKSTSFSNFWVLISFFGKIMPTKKKRLDTWDRLSLPEQSSCWWFLSYMVILSKRCEACQHWVIKHSWAFQVLALLNLNNILGKFSFVLDS